jgi:hypothetical protein
LFLLLCAAAGLEDGRLLGEFDESSFDILTDDQAVPVGSMENR